MAINPFKFSPTVVETNVLKRSVVNLLPGVNQTSTVQNFFTSSADHLFRPGSGIPLNGYIGDIPAWNDTTTDYYVAEPTTGRKFYQLSPAMVSRDADTNSYSNVLFYPDLINQLSFQGAQIDNQSRLFDETFYTWCPYVDLDKFVNYRKYWWLDVNSSYPDYLTISPKSFDENPWSKENVWVHESDITAKQKATATQAVRPIVEFLPNVELYNYGRFRRLATDYLETSLVDAQSYTGKKSIIVDGATITTSDVGKTGLRILITNDSDPDNSNKIYNIAVVNGKFVVTTDSDGQDPYGSPTLGEITKITNGTHKGEEYWYNGTTWVLAQSKDSVNQFPLFRLYDYKGNSLDNTVEYPGTSFQGSRVFSYNVDSASTSVPDSILGFAPTYDVNGQIQFCDYTAQDTFTYTENSKTTKISGYHFYNIMSSDGLSDEFSNSWRKSPYTSRQMVVDQFTANGLNKSFTLSQEPDPDVTGELSNISVRVSTAGTDGVAKISYSYLTPGVDYLRDGKNIIIQNLNEGDGIEVKTFSTTALDSTTSGFYEVPMNLATNPGNEPVDLVTVGDVYDQFTEIMSGQKGFSGQVYNINNWRQLISYDLTLGTSIVQNSSSILPLMLTCSDTDLDVGNAIRYASDEYTRFRNKFEIKITEYFVKGTYSTQTGGYDTWVNAALADISKGMTKTSPFYNSQMGVTSSNSMSYFIPPTPTFLGIAPIYKPAIITDYTIPTNPQVILGHDGSMTVCFGDFRDQVILSLETRIYQSIPATIRARLVPSLDIRDWYSTEFYKAQYSRAEYLSVIQGEFDRFATQCNFDRSANTTYDAANPFSYNWSSVESKIDGQLLPGSWRAIYNYYFGTDRPHTHPWEMFGFTIKPTWWDGRYGVTNDPSVTNPQNYYTKHNRILWNDVRDGFIADGDRKGYYTEYARPKIYDCIPVDEQGYLLDPYQAGIAKNYPDVTNASAEWNFGDQGAPENLWMRSSAYAFARTLALYLMKPARFMSTYWDALNFDIIYPGTTAEQQINTLLGERDQYDELYVHGEYDDNNVFVQRYGVQQFISNFLLSNNKSISTILGNTIRGLDVRLGHKMAGFTDSGDITVATDTNDIIPAENISVLLYRSPAVKKSFYSGVIVSKSAKGWRVYGYDNMDPEFNVIAPNTNLSGTTLTVGAVHANLVRTWKPNTYYPKGVIARTDTAFFLCIKSHTSSQVFESEFWTPSTRQDYSMNDSAIWYYNGNAANTVTTVPYGTTFSTVQELVNFLNGLQRAQEAEGWSFETLGSDGTVNDWMGAAQQFLNWHLDYANEGSFIALSPLSRSATYTTDIGEIQNVEQIINGQYGVVDKTGTPIEPYNTVVTRSEGSITLAPASNTTNTIFGAKLYVSQLEHVLIFDNSTVFDDIIYNPVMNVRQPRLKLQGYKTSNWNGRLDAPGFVISGNTLIPNFEKTTDDFRHFFNIESLDNDNLQERARANIGFFERSYMTNLSMSSTNQLEFYMGMIQDKGTPTVFNRLMRSDFIRNNKNISYHEEWAFRVGTYGADAIRPSVDFTISHDDIKNDPQLIEFNTISVHDQGTFNQTFNYTNNQSGHYDIIDANTSIKLVEVSKITVTATSSNTNTTSLVSFYGSLKGNKVDLLKSQDISKGGSTVIEINDPIEIDSKTINYQTTGNGSGSISIEIVYKISADSFVVTDDDSTAITLNDVKSLDSGKYIVKDSRWVQRFGIDSISWPSMMYDTVTPDFFPNAGYVNVDTIQWTAPTASDFYTLYHDTINSNAPTNFNVSYDFTQKGSSARMFEVDLIKSQQSGYFRVNSIEVTINQAPLINLTMNVGTTTQLPDGVNNTYSSTLISRFTNEDLTGTAKTITRYPSTFWKLDGSDNTIKLQFCSLDSSSIPSSLTIADISVTLDVDWITDSILPDDRVWVYDMGVGDWETFNLHNPGFNINTITAPSFTGQGSVVALQGYDLQPQNIIPDTSMLVFSGVQNITPDITTVYKPRYSNSVSVIVDGSESSVPLLTFSPDAGMQITKLTINVLKPFATTDGSDLEIDIGTDSTPTLLTQSAVLSNPAPTAPDFTAATPVTVKLANSSVLIADENQTVSIHIVRYGNIYGIPQSCADLPVTSVDWQYSIADPDTGAATTWITGGTVTFGNPQSTTDIRETYWHMVGELSYTADEGTVLIKLVNPVNAIIDSTAGTSTITASDSPTATTFDPTSTTSQPINTDLFNLNNDNDLLSVTVGPNTGGLAVVTLSYTYTNGFEMFTIDDEPYVTTDPGNGGNLLMWIPTRYDSLGAATSSPLFNLLSNGTFIELDDLNGLWSIGTKNGSSVNTTWTQQPKIETSLLKNAIVYNNNTDELEEVLEVYDPYKGFIPSAASTELKYILEYDPAVYNYNASGPCVTSNATWGKEQVGLLWWDVSTVRYLDYENIDLEYRWKHWGELCPGASVDVYEWVRSPVPPTSWNAYVEKDSTSSGFSSTPSGTVVDASPSWVEVQEWSDTQQNVITAYYFWVLSPNTIPEVDGRNRSATAVTSIITDPIGNDIAYFAVLDANHVIIGNIKEFISNDATIKLQWNIGTNEGNFHKQWCLLREGDDDETVDAGLWKKLTDSLVGFNTATTVYEVTGTTNDAIDYNTSSDITINVDSGDLSVIPCAGEIRIGESWLTYKGRIGTKIYGLTNDNGAAIKAGSPVYFRYEKSTPNAVPDPSLSANEALGNMIRPLQSWFPTENGVSSRSARTVFVDIMNSIFAGEPYVDSWYNWQDMFESSEAEPNSALYSYEAPDFLYRNQMVDNGIVTNGTTVLVPGQTETNGFWTLWQYNPSHPQSDAEGFILIDAQKWRLQEGDFWEFVDWYAEGWSSDQFPMYRFNTLAERDSANIDVTLLNGTLVEVANTDSSDPKWVRYIYNDAGWTEVAKEKATFKLLDTFYENTDVFGYKGFDLSTISSRDGSRELKWILDNMVSVMSSSQIMDVFFTMVRYAVAMDTTIDWAFKTSYMYLGGYSEQLNQEPVAFVDQMDNITDFIEEVKPYHVTIRDYISVYSAGPDNAYVHATDFDFPVYEDPALESSANRYRILSPEVIDGVTMENPSNANRYSDTQITAVTFPWADWYNNYTLTDYDLNNWTPKRNPIRHMTIEVKFDRIVCDVQIGWDPVTVPWDAPLTMYTDDTQGISDSILFATYRTDNIRSYDDVVVDSYVDLPASASKNGTLAYSLEDDSNYMWINGKWQIFETLMWDIDNQGGEASRILEYYQPTNDMPLNDVTCLLVGCGFRGTEVEGGPLEQGLWDMFPWDQNSGWANEFAYYDGGTDLNSAIDVKSKQQPSGITKPLTVDVRGRDFDVTSTGLKEDLPSDGVEVIGGNLIQPQYSEGHPEEAVPTQALASLLMVVTDTQGDKFSMIFGDNQSWDYTKLVDSSITVTSDNQTSIVVKCPSGFTLHDPANPTSAYLDLVKSSFVDTTLTEEEQNKITSRLMPGSILVQSTSGGLTSWEKIQYWDVEDNRDGTFTLGALQRNYTGVALRPGGAYMENAVSIESGSTVFDTSVVNWMTPLNQKMKLFPRMTPMISYENGTRNGNKVWELGGIVMCPQG